MNENKIPDELLYYSKIDKYCEDVILKNIYVITDPIEGFKDPFDCYFEIDFAKYQKNEILKDMIEISSRDGNEAFGLSIKELKCSTGKELKEKLSDYLVKIIRNALSKRLRIRCFSTQKEGAGRTLNSVLFSLYGDSHKGLCYIFDGKKLIPEKFSKSLIKVKYDTKPYFSEYEGPEAKMVTEENGQNMVRIKGKEWEYENEYRQFGTLEKDSMNINETCKFDPNALKGIVLGLKTTEGDEERIKKLVEKREKREFEVIIYKAERRFRSYELDY